MDSVVFNHAQDIHVRDKDPAHTLRCRSDANLHLQPHLSPKLLAVQALGLVRDRLNRIDVRLS